jgi:hypothetical protein
MRWPCISTFISAFWIPSMRTVRVTPPPPGSRAQHDFGQTELGLRVVQCNTAMAGQGDFQATAQRGAVQAGYNGLAQGFQSAQLAFSSSRPFWSFQSVGRHVTCMDQVQVTTRKESLLGGSDDDAGLMLGLFGLQAGHGFTHGLLYRAFMVLAD